MFNIFKKQTNYKATKNRLLCNLNQSITHGNDGDNHPTIFISPHPPYSAEYSCSCSFQLLLNHLTTMPQGLCYSFSVDCYSALWIYHYVFYVIVTVWICTVVLCIVVCQWMLQILPTIPLVFYMLFKTIYRVSDYRINYHVIFLCVALLVAQKLTAGQLAFL